MYVCIYRRLGGESNREIVFVSFVRACVRAGEARRGEAVCGRETMCLPWLGRGSAKSPPVPRSGARALPPVPMAWCHR